METLFKFLNIGEKFKRKGADIEWIKMKPFTAYGYLENQNARTTSSRPIHYDEINGDEVVYI